MFAQFTPDHPPPSAPSPRLSTTMLSELLSSIEGLDEEQMESAGRKLYAEYCVAPARSGRVTTHDGESVWIYPDDFDHAFFTAASRHRRGWAKDVIDPLRVARAAWIVPVIEGRVPGTSGYRVVDFGASKKPPPDDCTSYARNSTWYGCFPEAGVGGASKRPTSRGTTTSTGTPIGSGKSGKYWTRKHNTPVHRVDDGGDACLVIVNLALEAQAGPERREARAYA